MKLLGSLYEFIALVFSKDTEAITLRPNQSTTYTDSRDIQLPPGDTAHVLMSASSTATMTGKSFDADGSGNSITNIENADIKAGAAIDAAKIADGSVSNTEFQYISTLSSNAQTQLTANASATSTVASDLSTHISDTSTHGVTGDIVGSSDSQTLSNKTLTSPVLNGSLTGTGIKDEDNMASDSATAVPTQQSVKAYVDTEIAAAIAAGESLHTVTNNDYTILDADGYTTILFSTDNSARVCNLPTASANTNRRIRIKKIDSGTGTVEIEGEGSETVDGATEVFLYKQYECVTVQCDGSNWYIVAAEWASGTYTPTLTNVSNTSSITARTHQFKRVSRDRVQVSGGGTWSCTTTGAFIIDGTFPIASAIDNEYDAIGGGGSFSDRFYSCYISADETGNEFRIRGTCRDNGGALEGGWSFMYNLE